MSETIDLAVTEKQLWALACALDEPYEDGGPAQADDSVRQRAQALVRDIVAVGRNHPLHGAMNRLVGGTIVLRQMWERELSRPVPGVRGDLPASALRL